MFHYYINGFFFFHNNSLKLHLNMKSTPCYFVVLTLSLVCAFPHNSTVEEEHNEDKRIRGGTTIDISQAKYYVLMTCGNVMCGGTLVRRNKVITAGHCVDSCQVRNFSIAVGLNSISQYPQAKKYRASAINIHPKYNRRDPFEFDAAVVTLSQNVDLNQNVGTIPYASSVPRIGNSLTVVGYGYLNTNGQRAQRLQRANQRIVDFQTTRILTDATGPSVLPGDSGGPAVYGNQLAGITSGYQTLRGRIIRNFYVALGNREISSFVRRYAP